MLDKRNARAGSDAKQPDCNQTASAGAGRREKRPGQSVEGEATPSVNSLKSESKVRVDEELTISLHITGT